MLTGNREFNEIYEEYKNLVLKAAYIYSGDNYHAAEDITQDTFLKLYIGFEEFEKSNISSWLYTTAKNAAINYRKKNSKVTFIENYDELGEREPSVRNIEEEFMENETEKDMFSLREDIFSDLMEKNPRWYEAMILAYYMKVPQEKAAEMMEVKIEVFHSMLYRARKWIAKKYGVEYEEVKRK